MNKLDKFIPLGILSLGNGKTLGFDLFQKEEGNFRLYRHRSIPFRQGDIDKLLETGQEILYVPKNQRTALYEHISSNLTQTLTDPQIPVEEKMSALTEASTKILAEAVSSPNSAPQIRLICKQSENHVIFALLGGDAQKAMQTTTSEAPAALTHAISVCNYSILLGIRCGIEDQTELRNLGASALLHEIGKSIIDDKYYFRTSGNSKISNTRLKKYPSIGSKLLSKTEILPESSLRPILEHQERLDGSGFPNNLIGDNISLGGRIVAICDHFDESITANSQNPASSPFNILKSMRDESKKFDNTALYQFICLLGGVDRTPDRNDNSSKLYDKSSSEKHIATNSLIKSTH